MDDHPDTERDQHHHQRIAVYLHVGLNLEQTCHGNPEQNHRDAGHDCDRGAAPSSRLLLRRIEISDVGVRLGKCGMVDPRGNGKREGGGNERERREKDDAVRVHDLIGEDGGRRTEDKEHDADRDFAREGDHVLVVTTYIRSWTRGNSARGASRKCARGPRGRTERSVVRRGG